MHLPLENVGFYSYIICLSLSAVIPKNMLDFQDQFAVLVFSWVHVCCLLLRWSPGKLPGVLFHIPGGVSTLTALLVRMLKHRMDVI